MCLTKFKSVREGSKILTEKVLMFALCTAHKIVKAAFYVFYACKRKRTKKVFYFMDFFKKS